jgi:primosomal protein N''
VSNKDQNRQFRDAVREVERILERQLTATERDRLHREVSGMGFSFDTIVQVGLAMFG